MPHTTEKGGYKSTPGHPRPKSQSQRKLGMAMREVHENTPSTVKRAKTFGSGGKEAMLKAIAFSKARKAGARLPKTGKRGRSSDTGTVYS